LPEKTVAVSIRTSEKVYAELQKEAKEHDESLNTLVNQILRFETEFANTARKVGTQAISKSTYKELLDVMDEETVAAAAYKAGINAPKNFIESKHGEVNLRTVLDFLRVTAIYGRCWDYNETIHGNTTTLVLSHTLGRKYSVFVSNYVMSLFASIRIEPKVSMSDSSVIVELLVSE